ncbi:MAG: DUF3616 domain-containing protein [Deltaproteobacteria bacterium]|nr:DUF3616 domain-containing protein [Deltaproteobacteria bacterium]
MRIGLLLLGAVGCGVLLAGLLLWDARPHPRPTVLPGLCEASAVIPWQDGFLVGDNETEDRLHGFGPTMEPGAPLPLGTQVEDVEAVTLTPFGPLVVGSMGTNRKGRAKPMRRRVVVVGYDPLEPDLSGCPACIRARDLPPKAGGLAVEGAAWWRGTLWFGLRSPLLDGRAILLRMEGDPTVALEVAEVVPVDLGGLGIRDLLVRGDDLFVLAGPTGEGADAPRLFSLSAPGSPPLEVEVVLPGQSEGIAFLGEDLLVVTDGDGEPGSACRVPATWTRVDLPEP